MCRRACLVAGSAALLLAPHAEAADGDWSAVAESKFFYTNDVFVFSAARRLAVHEDPTQPTKVEINKPQDVVWEPALEVTRKFTSGQWPTEVSFKTQGFVYTDHPIFNHGTYRVQVRQALAPDTALVLRYRYSPNLFLGPNNERRSGQRLVEDERVTSHVWRAMLEHRLNQDWELTLVSRFGLRFFNEAFAERDLHFWTLGSEVHYRMMPRLTFTLSYLYERGLADGRNQPPFNDDTSYRNNFASLGTAIRVADPLTLVLTYTYQINNFTSAFAADTNRGRKDDTQQGIAEFRYALTDRALLMLGVQRTQRDSNQASAAFQDTNTWIGGQYQF
ncbi:MAG: hypothetical protein EPO64_00400 [Nitrospirae bacterium]|nr:MAG: hypothetical protein EPO64_00400 [Nitrospirota bacterium]